MLNPVGLAFKVWGGVRGSRSRNFILAVDFAGIGIQ